MYEEINLITLKLNRITDNEIQKIKGKGVGDESR